MKGYDLNSLTDYQSVLDFNSIDTDLNAEILNKLSIKKKNINNISS